ncbi:MAG: hypothetical protein ABFS37_04115 [Acidobacteriota bacterium]
MKGFFAIVVRELIDRRAVFAAAAFAALIPILLPFAPNMAVSFASDIREVTALGMGLGLAWILALFLGAGMIGGEMAQGGPGFFFSRPVSGSAIWLGKVAANWLLVVSVEAIVVLPVVVLFDSDPFFALNSYGWWLALEHLADGPALLMLWSVMGMPLLLILLAHTLGIMWRARSAWIALDAGLFVVFVVTLWFAVLPVALEVPVAVIALMCGVVLTVPVVLVFAGWAQVSWGRTDLQRGYRVLSMVMWALLALVIAGVVGYGARIRSVAPDDLLQAWLVESAPRGPWVEIDGPTAGRLSFEATFLFNLESEVYLRVPTWRSGFTSVAFAPNGERAAWLKPIDFKRMQLHFADLGEDRPRPRETPLVFDSVHRFILSEAGDRVAVFENGTLSFFEVETGNLVFATRWEWQWIRIDRFISDSLFRVTTGYRASAEPIEIIEVDLEARTVETTGIVVLQTENGQEDGSWWSEVTEDPIRDRFCLVEGLKPKRRWSIRNGRTGEIQVDLGLGPDEGPVFWSEDGRLVRASVDKSHLAEISDSASGIEDGSSARDFAEEGQAWIEVLSVEGGSWRKWPLGSAVTVSINGEPRPAEVSVTLDLNPLSFKVLEPRERSVTVNLDTGVIREVEESG